MNSLSRLFSNFAKQPAPLPAVGSIESFSNAPRSVQLVAHARAALPALLELSSVAHPERKREDLGSSVRDSEPNIAGGAKNAQSEGRQIQRQSAEVGVAMNEPKDLPLVAATEGPGNWSA